MLFFSFHQAKLFLLSKFVSAVQNLPGAFKYLLDILKRAAPGTLFLFVDNAHIQTKTFIEDLVFPSRDSKECEEYKENEWFRLYTTYAELNSDREEGLKSPAVCEWVSLISYWLDRHPILDLRVNVHLAVKKRWKVLGWHKQKHKNKKKLEEITRDIILLCGILLHFFSSSLILFLKGFGFYMNYIHWWNQAEKKDACICVMCMSFVSSSGKNIGQSGKYHNILWTAIWVVLHVKYILFCTWNACEMYANLCKADALHVQIVQRRKDIANAWFTRSTKQTRF